MWSTWLKLVDIFSSILDGGRGGGGELLHISSYSYSGLDLSWYLHLNTNDFPFNPAAPFEAVFTNLPQAPSRFSENGAEI